MNEHGPELNEQEESEVCKLLEREDEGEDVVWYRLHPAINRVECDRGVWSWHDPLVVWLVESLVNQRVVKTSVDPVDAEIGEDEEERELKVVIVWHWFIREAVVELRVAKAFGQEEGHGKDRNERHGVYSLSDLHSDLILEELWVLEGRLIEHEDVG